MALREATLRCQKTVRLRIISVKNEPEEIAYNTFIAVNNLTTSGDFIA